MKPKKSHRDQLRENDRSQRYLAAMSGRPVKEEWLNNVPAHKPRAKRAVGPVAQSEADIQRDIIKLLNHHPKVAKCWRQNSGTFAMQYGDKTSYVRANTARGMADIMGILKTGRVLAIEVKSAKGRVMEHQQEFIDSINKAGGLALIARSIDDVMDALERA